MGVRVLAADDDPSVLELLRAILLPYAASVDLARSGAEALRLLGERSYDLVVTDLQMPDVDGLKVLDVARRLRPAAVRVLVSGDTAALAAADAGGDSRIEKPFDAVRLGAIAAAADRRARLLDELRRRHADARDAVFVKDAEGRYLLMNAAGAALLGRTPEQVVGHSDAEIFDTPTLVEEVRAADEQVLRTGRPFFYCNTHRVTGRARTDLSAKFAAEPALIAGLSQDVTPILRRGRARAIADVVRAIEEFAALVAPGATVERAEVERCLQLSAERRPDARR